MKSKLFAVCDSSVRSCKEPLAAVFCQKLCVDSLLLLWFRCNVNLHADYFLSGCERFSVFLWLEYLSFVESKYAMLTASAALNVCIHGLFTFSFYNFFDEKMENKGVISANFSDFEGYSSIDGNESDLLDSRSDSEVSVTTDFSKFRVNSGGEECFSGNLETVYEETAEVVEKVDKDSLSSGPLMTPPAMSPQETVSESLLRSKSSRRPGRKGKRTLRKQMEEAAKSVAFTFAGSGGPSERNGSNNGAELSSAPAGPSSASANLQTGSAKDDNLASCESKRKPYSPLSPIKVKKTKTLAQVARPTQKIFIKNYAVSGGVMTWLEYKLVLRLLLKKLCLAEKPRPTFENNGLNNLGVFWILCSDSRAGEWVLATIPEVAKDPLLMGMDVRAQWDDANFRVSVVVPFDAAEPESVVQVLERFCVLNEGLDTSHWVPISITKPSTYGWFLILGIDEFSFNYLKNCDFRPNYGLCRVLFKELANNRGEAKVNEPMNIA